MMYENTEFGPAPIFRNCVWDIEDLLSTYRKEVVPEILAQCWAIDEMNAGVCQDVLIEDIWKGYEVWANETIEKEKAEKYEGLDERDFY